MTGISTSHSDSSEEAPQFGLVDVIEAFTAMRHQWRTQANENRELCQSLQSTADQIGELESRLLAAVTNATEMIAAETSDDTAPRLVEMIAEIDHHLTRAVDAVISTSPTFGGIDSDPWKRAVDDELDSLGPVKRWFCRSFATRVQGSIELCVDRQQAETTASHEGLQMLVARIRRMMSDHQIQRVETVGQPFDGESMTAVEAIETSEQPSGYVIEQIRPAYRWKGRLFKYADVRVAK